MNILLTGAGFTKNFGGLLASDMWYEIFNRIDRNEFPKLKTLATQYNENLDFEGFYNEVLSNDYSEKEKEKVEEAITKTFANMDNSLARWVSNSDSPYPIQEAKMSHFLRQFPQWFTTNQDLFVERHILNANFFAPLVNDNTSFRQNLRRTYNLPSECIHIVEDINPNTINTSELNKDFSYTKLHGSFNWKDNTENHLMVIGKHKDLQIRAISLLQVYLKKFESFLFQGNNKLLTIGYGFRDDHLNSIIEQAIEEHELKLYVMSPYHISELPKFIQNKIEKYFKYSLIELFPIGSGGETQCEFLKQELELTNY